MELGLWSRERGFGWEGEDKGALIDRGGGGDGGLEGEYGEKI